MKKESKKSMCNPLNISDLLVDISYDEIENHDIQVIAYAFDCIHYDKGKNIAVEVYGSGTVKIHKLQNGKKCIAMYGVLPQKVEEYEKYSKDNLSYFVKCLNKISRAKNLKSIAFCRDTFSDERYISALQEFSENVDALVYLYTKKVLTIHKSFGDLLGQIKQWKIDKAGWDIFFQARIKDKTIPTLNSFLQKEAEEYYIYPAPEEIFNAMILSKLSNIKVIIVAQDPYHTTGAAMGLAFSHKDEYGKLQPSLRNIYEELIDCGYKVNKKSGNLVKWAKQGVFLINTALTVRQGQANSHSKEWEPFTEHLFTFLNAKINHCVVMLWGSFAQKYAKYFGNNHKLLMTSHPCPMSAKNGFLGCKHFIKCNEQLKLWNIKEIDWNLV